VRRILLLITALTMFAASCSADDPTTAPDRPTPLPQGQSVNDDGEIVVEVDGNEVVLTAGLSGFDDCDNLLAHLRTEAANRVGPYGFNDGGYYGPFDRAFEAELAIDDVAAAEPAFAGSAESGVGEVSAPPDVEGVDFSGTNVQEVGVDEADVVKTDGSRIFIVANGQLVVIDAATRQVTGTLDIEVGWQTELFLNGDELLVISNGWLSQAGLPALYPEVSPGSGIEPGFAPSESTAVRVTRVQIINNRPTEVESIVVEGEYVSSRAIDGVARVIVRSNPQYRFPFVYPASDAGNDVAEAANRAAVEQSELTDWLPAIAHLDAKEQPITTPSLPDCQSVHAPTEFSGFGVLLVLSVPVGGDLNVFNTTSVLAPGNTVYASTDSIFVATQTWFNDIVVQDDATWEQAWNARRTSIHQFNLSANSAAYAASGSVAGDIRDQFSLSEYNGDLRVITTTGEQWDDTSETFVRILRPEGQELVEIGQVGDMGNGEAVQSVRFVGDVGYVVTFRQVDPFYTLDLSDPTNPRVVGELKIPGFSSYLHPIGNGRVLGVGSAGDADGRITGSKVSIFDVSDPANPTEVSVWEAPGGWTDIGWEHRSFLWWEPEQLAVIPVTTYTNGNQWAGAVVLKADGNTLTEAGRIDHLDNTLDLGTTDCKTITPADIGEFDTADFDSELGWTIQDSGSLVLLCGPGDSRSASGFDCYEDEWMLEEAGQLGVRINPDDTLVMCWNNYNQFPQVGRTMIIDRTELWSVSSPWGYLGADGPARLQVNDLVSLDRLGAINIG